MKERPILFSSSMARAILEGRKTQTRRTVRLPESIGDGYGAASWELAKTPEYAQPGQVAFIDMAHPTDSYPWLVKCPYGAPGDRLWVREAWQWYGRHRGGEYEGGLQYRADMATKMFSGMDAPADRWVQFREAVRQHKINRWRPSIHMPRWASRLTLEVTELRVQRLQEISGEDVLSEGCTIDSIKDWLEPIAKRAKVENLHWVHNDPSGESASYCWSCANKRVKKLLREKKNTGSDICVDGGWGGDEDCAQHCETCGVRLEACLTRYGVAQELEYHDEEGICTTPGGVYNFYDMLDGGDIPDTNDDDEVPDFSNRVARIGFRWMWDSIQGKRPRCSWADNPWCWCISFERIVDNP